MMAKEKPKWLIWAFEIVSPDCSTATLGVNKTAAISEL